MGIDEECGIPRDFQLSVSSGRMQTMLRVQNLDSLYIVKESFGEEIFDGWLGQKVMLRSAVFVGGCSSCSNPGSV